MKTILVTLLMYTSFSFAQPTAEMKLSNKVTFPYTVPIDNITQETAFEIANNAINTAAVLDKKIAIAVLDASGTLILLTRNNEVGPHNIEAARRKAYTALSTKTTTLFLARNATSNSDTVNLNSLPELLLLGGGVPIEFKGKIIGSIGIAGGGSPENDDAIAKSALIRTK